MGSIIKHNIFVFKSFLVFLSFSTSSLVVIGQSPAHNFSSWNNYDPFFDTLLTNNVGDLSRMNSSVKPVLVNRKEALFNDSLLESELTKNRSDRFYIWPAANLIAGNSVSESFNGFSSRFGIGGAFSYSSRDERFHLRGTVLANTYSNDSLNDRRYEILENSYFTDGDGGEIQPQFRASFNANKFFQFQAGIDHNFIGEGDRSIILGDYTSPYPFFKIRSKLWRFEFVNIYQFLDENVEGKFMPKFTSSHYLNYNVTDRFSFGVFESVIYSPQDEYLTRGIEWEYLNPFIFYRPIEYGLGSQDKIVVGTNLSYSFDNLMLYGQFVLDEFVLNELVNRTRWWANKYAGQIGLKGKFTNRKNQFNYRTELNFARPFTFAHLDERTVYGHQGIPLGHPLGANFVELFSTFSGKFTNDLMLTFEAMWVQQGGMDGTEEVTYGDDIYIPYTNRPTLPGTNTFQDYGYRIGGDGKLNRLRFSVEIDYPIYKKWNLHAFARPALEFQNGYSENTVFMIFGGVKSSLWNERSFRF